MKVLIPIFLQFPPNSNLAMFDFSTSNVAFPVKYIRLVSSVYEPQNSVAGAYAVITSDITQEPLCIVSLTAPQSSISNAHPTIELLSPVKLANQRFTLRGLDGKALNSTATNSVDYCCILAEFADERIADS